MSMLEQQQIEMAIRASMLHDAAGAGDSSGGDLGPTAASGTGASTANRDLQEAIQTSLASAGKPNPPAPAAPAAVVSSMDYTSTEDEDMQRAIRASLADLAAKPPMPPP